MTRAFRIAVVLTGLVLAASVGFLALRRIPRGGLPASAPSPSSGPLWTPVATAPQVRYEVAVALVRSKVFIFGGFFNEKAQATARIDVFDPATRSWTRPHDMPVAFTHANAALLGDTIWFAGGFEGDSPGAATSRVWRYDPLRDGWSEGPPLPEPRASGALVTLAGALHYFGGWKADRKTDAGDHWVLDPGQAAWRRAAPLPTPRGHLAGVVLGGRIYAVGGCQGHDPVPVDVDVVERYDPAADRWEPVAPLPLPRSHIEPGTFVRQNRIVVVGGRSRPTGRPTLADVSEYDPATDRWTALPSLPEPLLAPVALALGDSLLAGLGASAVSTPTNATFWMGTPWTGWAEGEPLPAPLGNVVGAILHERLYLVGDRDPATLVLDLTSGRWLPGGLFAERPGVRGTPTAEVVNGSLYLLGGYFGDRKLVQQYDPVTNRWRLGPALPFAAASAASAVIAGRLYLAGGIADDGTPGQAAVLDSAAGHWRAVAPLPVPLTRAASGTDGTRLYLFGGVRAPRGPADSLPAATDAVQIYDPSRDHWVVSGAEPGAPAPVPAPRTNVAKAVFYRGEFYLIGGQTRQDGGVTGRVDIYNPSTNTWRSGAALPTPRQGIFPLLRGDRIYLAGGRLPGGEASARLEVYVP